MFELTASLWPAYVSILVSLVAAGMVGFNIKPREWGFVGKYLGFTGLIFVILIIAVLKTDFITMTDAEIVVEFMINLLGVPLMGLGFYLLAWKLRREDDSDFISIICIALMATAVIAVFYAENSAFYWFDISVAVVCAGGLGNTIKRYYNILEKEAVKKKAAKPE